MASTSTTTLARAQSKDCTPQQQPVIYRLLDSDNSTSQYFLSPSPALPLRTTTLSERLQTWLDSPLAAPPIWEAFNALTCGNPSVRREQNQLHFRDNLDAWRGIGVERVKELREELAGVLRKAVKEGKLTESGGLGAEETTPKRAIVWTAGNADTFDRVLTSLRLLRHSYNSSLPALVYHFPSESPSESQLALFTSLNTTVHALESLDKAGGGRTKSFHLKGAALVQAFKETDEVLMLDSDNVPVRDPEGLFESREFREMGAVFWPDYWKDQPENAIWSILGVQCRDEFTIEAGQVLLRQSDHLDAILLVEHMLKDWEFWFKLSDGDKDLFRYAFLALRKRWGVPARHLSTASWLDRDALGADKRDRFAGHTMLQYGLAGEPGEPGGGSGGGARPMFVHANLLKRITANLYNGNTFGRTLQLRLPPPPSNISSDFIFHCDYLVNVSPFTGVGLLPSDVDTNSLSTKDASPLRRPSHPTPLWVRQQALLSRGLETRFFDGHYGFAYVLAIENVWRDELALLDKDEEKEALMSEVEMQRWRERMRHERERVDRCGQDLRADLVGEMEIVPWADDPDLSGFEDRFYNVGEGKAGGFGFRA
ncbi:hypothetical protein JCM10908_002298 [Rhodotorula pacifica]|uniref:uncharacterized protein n=1 Tax=Rhodotorula pacifica TaxID=1495444 RepID=UPI00317FC295